jgi:hypothetical protein
MRAVDGLIIGGGSRDRGIVREVEAKGREERVIRVREEGKKVGDGCGEVEQLLLTVLKALKEFGHEDIITPDRQRR